MTSSSMSIEMQSHSHRQKSLWNVGAISYILTGYGVGVALILLSHPWLNAIGTLFLAHSLICSAYLSHEFMHGNIFRSRQWNTAWGNLMLWLNGGCYYGFQVLTSQHIAHHVDRVDVFTFDIQDAIQKLPRLLRWTVLAMEWCYVPVVAFWSRWRSISAPWWNDERRDQRLRVTAVFCLRLALFITLGYISLKALLLYFLAYLIMITVLRFVDAFQHTYEAFLPGIDLPKRDRNHEQSHTFTNLISYRYPLLNLLLLNFGYHNAHHAVMRCPWHSLHQLDRELSNGHEQQYISLGKQIQNYHQFRITRLLLGQGDVDNHSLNKFYGAADVSFITLY
jgi:fatty acid desaturase